MHKFKRTYAFFHSDFPIKIKFLDVHLFNTDFISSSV